MTLNSMEVLGAQVLPSIEDVLGRHGKFAWKTNTVSFPLVSQKCCSGMRGTNTTMYFEVIETMGETYPYQTPLIIGCSCDNYGIIDMENRMTTFKSNGVNVIQPLDLH